MKAKHHADSNSKSEVKPKQNTVKQNRPVRRQMQRLVKSSVKAEPHADSDSKSQLNSLSQQLPRSWLHHRHLRGIKSEAQ